MRISLVVFDMAGTTVCDGDAVHKCLQATLAAEGIEVGRDAVNDVMGMPKPLAIRLLLERELDEGRLQRRQGGGERCVSDVWVGALHDDFVRRMTAYYREDPAVREIEPASAVFRELRRRGIKVALDTGFSRNIVDVILERLGWAAGSLDATVASDEVARGRPHPDLILRAMELTGVTDAVSVAKVGDTPADLLEGQAAGCGLLVGVTDGSHTRQQLDAFPYTHLIANVGALPGLLSRLDSEQL